MTLKYGRRLKERPRMWPESLLKQGRCWARRSEDPLTMNKPGLCGLTEGGYLW